MKKNNIMVDSAPSAYVTKRKQRIKQYDKTVYLKNGDEFEIELYNPTQNKVLAKIEINGHDIGGTGIVLRPGERAFLERYLSPSRKFMFETYLVNGNNDNVKKAIQNNGDVTVKFYQQYIAPTLTWYPYYYTTYPQTWSPSTIFYNSSSTINPITYNGNTLTGSAGITLTGSNNMYVSSSLSNVSYSTTTSNANLDNLRSTKKNNEIETGRVEMGSQSNQKFTTDSSTFYSYYSWISTWKILPISQKETVIEDLKIFCGECGSKRKKDSHKFCPHCGTKY